MDNHEFTERTLLKDMLGSFISSYAERDRDMEFSGWLADRLRQEMPDMPKETCGKLAGEIMEAVAAYHKTLEKLNRAASAGQPKEEWLAERLAGDYADMPIQDAGKKLQQMENALTVSNMQLMQGIGERQAEDGEESIIDADSIQWNEYSVKNTAYGIGNQFILSGMAAAANVLKERMQNEESPDIEDIVRETFRESLKKDPEEVKAVVAGAVRAAAEKGIGDIVPRDTPAEVISVMSGAAVESAGALYDVASGESTMIEAMDQIGRAGVAAGCHYASGALRGRLAGVPFIGPVLVDLMGGLLEHMDSPKFTENVYTTVRDAVRATWEGIKKSRVVKAGKRLVKGVKKMIFG